MAYELERIRASIGLISAIAGDHDRAMWDAATAWPEDSPESLGEVTEEEDEENLDHLAILSPPSLRCATLKPSVAREPLIRLCRRASCG